MIEYITAADVEAIKGVDWYGDADPDASALQANVWMQAYGVREDDPTSDDVKQAGAILAVMAADGLLYADSKGAVKRKRVKADTVETETEYQSWSSASSGQLALAKALLAPYVTASAFGASVRYLTRV